MQLTPEQARAVQSWQRGDICVTAGPGSGKTRVLVERLRWLVLERGVAPERILAITFTEKAAYEMRSRLVAHSSLTAGQRSALRNAQVSTIDAFCSRLLKENALQAGVDPAFEVLDEAESKSLLRQAVHQVLDAALAEGGQPLADFLASYAPAGLRPPRGAAFALQEDLAQLVPRARSLGCEPFLKESGVPLPALIRVLRGLAEVKDRPDLRELADRFAAARPEDTAGLASLLAAAKERAARLRKQGKAKTSVRELKDELLPACEAALVAAANGPARRWLLAVLRRILENFGMAKAAAGRLDFDDMLARAAALLRADDPPELAFEHVLIDEFQDTNPLQVQLVDSLLRAHGELPPVRFVVGDINQSIYGFRHADQNVFREFRETVAERGGEIVRLLENFRSHADILAAVHRLLPGGGTSGVEAHRLLGGNRFPAHAAPRVEVLIVAEGGDNALEREAAWLAQRLLQLKASLRVADRTRQAGSSRNLAWSDIAVLVRTHDRAARFAAVLRQYGIPSQTGGGRGLFQAGETVELAAFLRILRNPRDEISLAAVLKSAFCGINDATLLRLKVASRNLADSLEPPLPPDVERDPATARRLQAFRELLRVCRADCDTLPVRRLLARAVAACGYRSALGHRDDGSRALANLDRLLEWLDRRAEQGFGGVDRLSEALDDALEYQPTERDAPHPGAQGAAVEVLTMHAAKGLEFPVVAVASLQSDVQSGPTGLHFSDQYGLGARWRRPFDRVAEDPAYRLTAAAMRQREREEADRLLYVALTRAEERLLLSASFPRAPQRKNWCKPLFGRFGLDPQEPGTGEPETRVVEGLRFRYLRTDREPAPPGAANADPAHGGPEILRPLPATAQADFTAAVTSIAVFAECPRKYYLSRFLGLAEPPSPLAYDAAADPAGSADRDGLDASEFGEQVHRYLAGRLEAAAVKPAGRRLADKFQNHELGRRAARAECVAKELSFVFAVGGPVLRGTIDLLFEEGGERILVDYKTDSVPRARLRAAAERYAPQLQLYAAGLALSGQPADRAVLFFLRRAAPIDIDIGPPALAHARRLAADFFDAQSQHEFPLRTGGHCRQCPHFRGPCPAKL